jgi:DMSO/TMAO reductase YedYZ molybdopterin-dependent catalytic subunit
MLSRRDLLTSGSALAVAALLPAAEHDEQVIPFLDTKPLNPERPTLPWDQTTSWITPKDHFFAVAHYGYPTVDLSTWRLEVAGLVENPRSFTLEALQSRPVAEFVATLECSGNPAAGGLVANTKWAGAPLALLLKECGLKSDALEVVFYGADQATEKIRASDYPQQFARSLSVVDALRENVLLCWQMHGEPLTSKHGAPLRLVVPGWYGVAWVKWLTRIEVHDRKFLNRFMGRDYVTIRGEPHGDQVIWRETSVGRMNLKSVVGRVTRRAGGGLRVSGAAWSDGTPIRSVEVRIDDAAWTPAVLKQERKHPYAWVFWSWDWNDAAPGEHSLTCRAIDTRGAVQPDAADPRIAMKKTYWESNQQAVRKIRV